MAVRKRWWVGAVCVVVSAALASGVTLWIQHREAVSSPSVSIDIDPSLTFEGEEVPRALMATVTNDTGHEITDVDLRFTLYTTEGDRAGVAFGAAGFDESCGVEDPGMEPECVRQQYDVQWQWCRISIAFGADGQVVVCEGDIPTGTSQYPFSFYPDAGSDSGLALRARLRSGDKTLSTAREDLV